MFLYSRPGPTNPLNARRRGTVLVLVVGVLALMAIIVVMFTTIGQSDRRGAAALVRQAAQQDRGREVGEYIAGVLGESTFAVQMQQQALTSGGRRETTPFRVARDYPGVDMNMRSMRQSGDPFSDALLFDPTGSQPVVWPAATADPRVVVSPWLATSQPTRLDDNTVNANGMVFPDPNRPWEDFRDWRSISNLAPDGRFVNLANLRNSFNQPSGIGAGTMTYGLTLLTDEATLPTGDLARTDGWPRATARMAFSAFNAAGQQRANVPLANLDSTNYFPFDYSANQAGLFRSGRDDRGGGARIATLPRAYAQPVTNYPRLVPGDWEYLSNQYADTDGDGFLDARWFELVNAANIRLSPDNKPQELLGPSDLRYFVAARVVDLSGKVNVNTATSFAVGPDDLNPAGLTPADIDLEQLLSLRHAYYGNLVRLSPGFGSPPRRLGYEEIGQPRGWYRPAGGLDSEPSNYRTEPTQQNFQHDPLWRVVGRATMSMLLDYRARASTSSNPGGAAWPDQFGNMPVDRGIVNGQPVTLFFARPVEISEPGATNAEKVRLFPAMSDVGEVDPQNANTRGVFRPTDRRLLYELSGRDNTGVALNNKTIGDDTFRFGASGQFTLEDELELRTFERLNDPANFSTLEQVLSGRYNDGTNPQGGTAGRGKNLSPLRSNRPLVIERLDRDITDNSATGNGPRTFDADGNQDGDAYLQGLIDVRQMVTTLSGARPLFAGALANAGAIDSLGEELRLDVTAVLEAANLAGDASDNARYQPNYSVGAGAVERLFRLAADALLPFSAEPDAGGNVNDSSHWVGGPGNQARTLSYGGGRLAYNGARTDPRTPVRDLAVPAADPQNFLGSSAEFALRAAAHWAVNLADARQGFSREGEATHDPAQGVIAADRPSEFTVVIGSQFRGTGSQVADELSRGARFGFPASLYPSWSALYTNTAQFQPRLAGGLDLDRAQRAANDPLWRLPNPTRPTPAGVEADAVTVFGIRPQPFVVQAQSMIMYAADRGAGDKLVIDRTVGESNRSYIGEVVAFHLHNPFDTQIALSALRVDNQGRVVNVPDQEQIDNTSLRYYIEFAGKYYGLADYGPTEGDPRAVTLNPGETRVFWISDAIPSDMVGRIYDVSPLAADRATFTNQFWQWLQRQLFVGSPRPSVSSFSSIQSTTRPRTEPVRLAEIDPTTLNLVVAPQASGGILRVGAGATPADIESNRVVRLWRVRRTADETNGNFQLNDVLVDRLRDPQAPGGANNVTLNGRLRNDVSIDVGNNNNSGVGAALVRWGQIRRPGDPLPNVGNTLPAYCMETKFPLPLVSGNDLLTRHAGVQSWNEDAQDPNRNVFDTQADVTLAQFTFNATTARNVGRDFLALVNGLNTATEPMIDQADREPHQYTPPTSFANLSGVQFVRRVNNVVRSTRHLRLPMLLPAQDEPTAENVSGRVLIGTRAVRYLDPVTNQQVIRPVPPLRPADLLDIPAIGPSHNPVALRWDGAATLDDKYNLDAQWTTLAEAAALAADFDSPANVQGQGQFPTYYRVGAELALDPTVTPQGGAARVDGGLAGGRLIPDQFVPFVDVNENLVYDEPLPTDRARDIRRGTGSTFAMDLLNRARTNSHGTRTSIARGVVNINTAPLAVLRTLPLLAPSHAGFMGVTSSRGTDPLAAYDSNSDPFDIAATLAAYRDQAAVQSRVPVTAPAAARVPNFRADNSQDVEFNGRSYATGIAGIREEPGFGSIGEVLAAKVRGGGTPFRFGAGTVTFSDQAAREVSIDRFAQNLTANEARFPYSRRLIDLQDPEARLRQFTSGQREIQGIIGDYVTQAAVGDPQARTQFKPLNTVVAPGAAPARDAIANAVLNSISVRSDLFCVWFVLHGYSAANVEGLGPEDPMVPTVSRRYVMVVDRSAVVTKGDKPRILMFKEVPIN